MPPQEALAERLDAVLHVVYLVYNEGYSATSGAEHLRRDLSAQALSMSRLLVDLLPEPEATGLLALLLLHEARSESRTDAHGDPIPLEEQDRALWNQNLIAEGVELVWKATLTGRIGSYTIQAAIAATHAKASSAEATDWHQIVGYYDLLSEFTNSPVVALNRAIAIGMRDGPVAGLELLEALLETPSMSRFHRAHAARAELALRSGAPDKARGSFERALELARQEPERRFLERRLEQIRK